jgi:hypothetical protein
MKGPLVRILVAIGSLATIGFGVWHFFLPRVWRWASYIDPRAGELIVAVAALNFLFSLSLVLFGLMNILLVFGGGSDRRPIAVVLSASCLLWFARVILQVVSPQGSMNPLLQYAMLLSFLIVFLCYSLALFLFLRRRPSR